MTSLWTQETEAINLGKGHPNPSFLPLTELQESLNAQCRVENSAVTLMQYGAMQGPPSLCESIAEWTARAGNNRPNLPKPSNILITTGSGPGMSLGTQLFSKGGDLVFVDSPGYFLSYFTFKDCRLSVVNIPTDKDGMNLDYMQELLEQGQVPSIVYTVPIGNNPTGASMSEDRKRRLVELAQKYNFKILADEVYQFLSFDPELPTSLFEYDDATNPCVLAVGSFSKLLGPGLRLGWIATHEKHMQRLLDCGPLHSGGGFNPFMGTVVDHMIRSGFVEKHVEKIRKYYSKTCEVLCEAVDKYVITAVKEGEIASYLRPTGGFFLFITLPERFDTQKLLAIAANHGVSYFAGANSSPDKSLFRNCIRLCFAFQEEDVIVEGVKRLGEAIKSYT